MYTAHKIDYAFRDQDAKPCFGVRRVANEFVSQLNKIVQSKVNDTQREKQNDVPQSDRTEPSQPNDLCMFGIFGQWGRGKTYLWHQIRDIITDRNDNQEGKPIHYDIVEFNAWKYQDTPALWAYLYETIYNKGNCWIRFRNRVYQIKTHTSLCLYITLFLCLCVVATIVVRFCNFSFIWKVIAGATGIIATISSLFSMIEQIHIFHTNIQAHCGYRTTLGIQNEVEKDLEKLLRTWVCKRQISRHRILLYVDDIDRCDEDKMISILDSLRTILENPEIQKRLVVVCSLDRDRIVAAIQKKYLPTQPNDGNPAQRNIVTEQLDKLFIFSVGLPQLDTTQQQRFIDCLSQNTAKEQDKLPYSTARTEQSLYSTTVGALQDKQISEKEIIAWLHKFIEDKKDYSLTPRKLRIIYYRMLFANNLMADQNEVYFTEQFAQNIFGHSIHREIGDSLVNQCFSDILEMVVPY